MIMVILGFKHLEKGNSSRPITVNWKLNKENDNIMYLLLGERLRDLLRDSDRDLLLELLLAGLRDRESLDLHKCQT